MEFHGIIPALELIGFCHGLQLPERQWVLKNIFAPLIEQPKILK